MRYDQQIQYAEGAHELRLNPRNFTYVHAHFVRLDPSQSYYIVEHHVDDRWGLVLVRLMAYKDLIMPDGSWNDDYTQSIVMVFEPQEEVWYA